MSTIKNFEEAARRHYNDGKWLEDARRFDNAGYHYGFAAECAVKHLLGRARRPKVHEPVARTDDPIWAHFPDLRSLALLAVTSRAQSPLNTLLGHDSFMQEWSTNMRYSENASVSQQRVDKWRDDANKVIGLML